MTDPIPWHDIVPLPAQADPPPFPTDALPGWLEDFVRAQATASAVPEDLPGMLALSMLSTATQGRINAVANAGNWVEPIGLYTAIAMNPGERKSAVFTYMARPLEEWEIEVQQLEMQEVATSRQQTKELEQQLEATQREIARSQAEIRAMQAKGISGDEIMARRADLDHIRSLAIEAQLLYDQHRERKPMRLLFDDITPEAVATALSEQFGERIGILSAEGGIFDILGGRYSDKPALDIFLKGHSADSYRVDRKGRDSEIIRRPVITLGLAVQPAVFQAIGRSKDMHGRGLLARFLYCVPESALGSRDIRPANVPPEIRALYGANLREIAGSAYATPVLQTILLDDDADEAFMTFQAELEPRLDPENGDFDQIIEWASKFAGAILRIASLLAVARTKTIEGTKIGLEDMENALKFAPYLEIHAWRAFALMGLVGGDSGIESKIINRIRRMHMERFTVRELMRVVRSGDLTARDFEEILRGLETRTYMVRERAITPNRSYWEVNPGVFT